MLNKNDIITLLRKINLPRDQYCVMTGAALVLHGVKPLTRDIDIGCSKELFAQLLQQGYQIRQMKEHAGILIDDCMEIFENWQAEKTVYVDGIPVADIYSIRRYKERLSREKDLRDIALIDEYLAAKLR